MPIRLLIFPLLLLVSCGAGPTPKTPTELFEDARPSIVRVSSLRPDGQHSVCTGFVVSFAHGWVLTARHCVYHPEQTTVDEFPTQVVRISDTFALLQIPFGMKPHLEFAKKRPKEGTPVVAIGYGYNILGIFTRHIVGWDGSDFAFDGGVPPGMSGAPVLDSDGRVVGLVQATSQYIGLACGLDEIQQFLKAK